MKTVRVRFPSDDEWAEGQRRRKVIVRQRGRAISETTIPNGEEIDAKLLAKIRTEEEPEVAAFEAQKVVEQFGDLPRGRRGAGRRRLPTTHLIKMPSATDVNQFLPVCRRSAFGDTGFLLLYDVPEGLAGGALAAPGPEYLIATRRGV